MAWNSWFCLFASIAGRCINIDSLYSVPKERYGLLCSPCFGFQNRVWNRCQMKKWARHCRGLEKLPPFCFLSLFKHVALCDISYMTGQSVPEAMELSGGKRNLAIGRWRWCRCVWSLPPVHCYTEPPLARLSSSLTCPWVLHYCDPAKYLLALTALENVIHLSLKEWDFVQSHTWLPPWLVYGAVIIIGQMVWDPWTPIKYSAWLRKEDRLS